MEEPPEEPKIDNPAKQQKVRSVESEQLFEGQKQLIIRHAGEQYRLILTRNNRLILQK